MSDKNSSKLSDFFSSAPPSSHPSKWSALWAEAYTPWDRGGPSLALYDLLLARPDLVPPVANLAADLKAQGQDTAPATTTTTTTTTPRALVPGCGRGHDAILLAAMGYDVVGMDFAPEAIREAAENEAVVATALEEKQLEAAVYQTREGAPRRGKLTWVSGDFFDDAWLLDAGLDKDTDFDLIYDYTFLCALHPSVRPKWAARMSSLLNPRTGRLVCLEFPSSKPPVELGPPWGLTPEIYLALLARPGEDIAFDEADKAIVPAMNKDTGLERLELIKPARTHKAGTNESGSVRDWLHVWKRVGDAARS